MKLQPTACVTVLLLCAALMFASSACMAKIVYVKTTGLDANDGLAWDTAKKTVRAGINASAGGDEIWIAAGTYVGCNYMKKGVGLYGGFVGTETERTQRNWNANVTILDGNKGGSVVTSPWGATATTVIDGFTMRNGGGSHGGGIYCESNSSPIISNNTIVDNRADSGGGIFCSGHSSPMVTKNTITGNSATYGGGGGIGCEGASPTIIGNTISRNRADRHTGGGISCAASTLTITDNIVIENSAGYEGGGIHCYTSSATISNNVIMGNISPNGGGVYCMVSSPTITNNTIIRNSANYQGGGILCRYTSSPAIINNIIGENSASRGGGICCSGVTYGPLCVPTIINNTITGNSGARGGGVFCEGGSDYSPMITNNIIAYNSSGVSKETGLAMPVLKNNCVYGNSSYDYFGLPAGTGDIATDPLFVDAGNEDYRLRWDSLCVDTGRNEGAPTTDFLGNFRPIDGNSDSVPITDIGAFEYQPVEITLDILPGDASNSVPLNKNGMVTVAIIGTYGLDVRNVDSMSVFFGPNRAFEAHGRGHFEDVNGDGQVDMLLHFRCQDIGLTSLSSALFIAGRFISGEPFVGSDVMSVVGATKTKK